MASTAQEVLEQILEEGGFVQNGIKSSGLIDGSNVRDTATTDLRYRNLFDRKDGPVVDLVYEVPNQVGNDVPGTSAIYFKVLENPSPKAITQLRSRVWNQGRTPTLWIVTPRNVLIYNSYARQQVDESDEIYLLEELKSIGGQVHVLNDFHKKNFDTGEFWQSKYGKKIKQNQRIDRAMLNDLSIAEGLLISSFKKRGLISPTNVAHAILGRSIFASYLADRGILKSSFFEEGYGYGSFKELLNDRNATYTFFRWLRETFNGNLFPFDEEEEKVSKDDLKIVNAFLIGVDMSKYPHIRQERLWGYEFNFIPVELISSIYEMFAHSSDSQAAEERSTHYTRLQLVELVLSIAMNGLKSTARILDPACGSGIFLVEAFKRLVWMRKNEHESDYIIQRDELRHILHSQIFGIDIDREAVDVTAFSLYLTLLELDPDPQPPTALKFLPLLASNNIPYKVPNLYVQDFCNSEHIFNQTEPFVNQGFELIVGNPPWTALNESKAPRDPDNPISGRQWALEYCEIHAIPGKKPDQAFMVRAGNFASINTRIVFIVCSRLFYQIQDPMWLDTFLGNNTVETVMNLSDLVGMPVLFGGNSKSSTQLPASVIIFRAVAPSFDHKVMYLTPKWYLNVDKQDEILITTEDIHDLSQKLLRSQPFLWKSAFRGVARDYRLLSKLQQLPTLKEVLLTANVLEDAHRGVIFGKGKQHDASSLQGKPFLASGQMTRYGINIDHLDLFNRLTAERRYDRFLQLPALIISRSLHDQRVEIAVAKPSSSGGHLVIDQMYYGIPGSSSHPALVYQLNAILNSNLAFYMAFMFSSALGWDRKLVEEGDWQQIRLPLSILDPMTTPVWQEILQHENWLRENWQPISVSNLALRHEILQRQQEMEKLVFKLYELSEQEIILVEDTIALGITPILARNLRNSYAMMRATTNDLQNYAGRLCTQLNGILDEDGQQLTAIVIEFKHPSPLRACRFRQRNLHTNEIITVIQFEGIDNVIEQMSQDLRAEIADHVYVQRSLHVYEPDGFWIIKSAEKHLWSESAALNDADMIVCEHMEEDMEDE